MIILKLIRMKIEKITTIILWALVAVSVILVVLLAVAISNTGGTTDEQMADASLNSWLSNNLGWAYILFAITTAIAVGFGLYQMFSTGAAAKRGIITLVAAAIVFGVSYALASDSYPAGLSAAKILEFETNGTLTHTIAKWSDLLLIAAYILFGLTLIATLATSLVVKATEKK
jgi:hypothetical protein